MSNEKHKLQRKSRNKRNSDQFKNKKAATELLNYLDICNQWYSSFKQKAKLPLLKPTR